LHGKGNIVQKLLVLSLLLLPTMAMANHPLPPIPEGMHSIANMDCSDKETGEKGFCILLQDSAGERYMAFYQGGEVMFIRQITGDGTYITLWTADRYNTY